MSIASIIKAPSDTWVIRCYVEREWLAGESGRYFDTDIDDEIHIEVYRAAWIGVTGDGAVLPLPLEYLSWGTGSRQDWENDLSNPWQSAHRPKNDTAVSDKGWSRDTTTGIEAKVVTAYSKARAEAIALAELSVAKNWHAVRSWLDQSAGTPCDECGQDLYLKNDWLFCDRCLALLRLRAMHGLDVRLRGVEEYESIMRLMYPDVDSVDSVKAV